MVYKRLYIEAIWKEPESPTYIMDRECLVDITKTKSKKSSVDDLIEQVDNNMKLLVRKGINVVALYFGKTNVKETDNFDRSEPITWDSSGISRRFSDHKTPDEDEIQGQRNMIILTRAIANDNVPDKIEKDYQNQSTPKKGTDAKMSEVPTTPTRTSTKTKSTRKSTSLTPNKSTRAKCAAEHYALELEEALIEYYDEKAKGGESVPLEQTKGKGDTSENPYYVVYMRITHLEGKTETAKDDSLEKITESIENVSIHSSKESRAQGERPKKGTPKKSMDASKSKRQPSYEQVPTAGQKVNEIEEVKGIAKSLSDQLEKMKEAFDAAYDGMKTELAELEGKIEQLQLD